MRGSRWFSGVGLIVLLADAAGAQTAQAPRCFMWQRHPELDHDVWNALADFNNPTPSFVPITTINLNCSSTPAAAAAQLRQELLRAKSPGGLHSPASARRATKEAVTG